MNENMSNSRRSSSECLSQDSSIVVLEQQICIEIETECIKKEPAIKQEPCDWEYTEFGASEVDCSGVRQPDTSPAHTTLAKEESDVPQRLELHECEVKIERLSDEHTIPDADSNRSDSTHDSERNLDSAAANQLWSRPDQPHSPNNTEATYNTVHIETTPYAYDKSKDEFTNLARLKEHEPVHRVKRFRCKICEKEFGWRTDLRRHELSHTGAKPYVCEICKKGFARAFNLKVHERMHSDDRPYSCDLCEKKFKMLDDLNGHKRIHCIERPYSCGICNNRFTLASRLKIHERVHTGEKPYTCDVCHKRFTHGSDLKRHARVHSDERPYSCSICKQTFKQGSHLKNHERVHSGKTYSCGICKKQFDDLASLKSHEGTHTGEQSLPWIYVEVQRTL